MFRGRAFGIDIETDVDLAALPPAERTDDAATRVTCVGSPGELDRDWPAGEAVCLEDARASGGVMVHTHPDAGFRIEDESAGAYRVSGDGLQVTCGFERLDSWDRQRFLSSRVLPLAATLRGLELLHAGCVGLAGGAVAFLGNSRAGKSSLTLQLVLRGGTFLTDDLLAVELRDGAPYVHPGLAVAGVRYAERDLMSADELASLRPVEDRDGKVWVAPGRASAPLPLRAICLLVRDPDAPELRFESVAEPDPRELLASSFFARMPVSAERVARQLEVWSTIAMSVPIIRIVIPSNVEAASLAERIRSSEDVPFDHAAAA